MRISSVLITALLIAACNNTAKKTDDTKDTVPQIIQMPQTPAVPDTGFTGFGTEPFWSVYIIDNSRIVFHPADGTDVEMSPVASMGDNSTTKYTAANNSTTMELIITKKECSDGMSDRVHPYAVALSVNKKNYSGCGRMKN